ncbi:MAG: hypothetical protein ACLUSP_03200 [Christensenellales bacterium]
MPAQALRRTRLPQNTCLAAVHRAYLLWTKILQTSRSIIPEGVVLLENDGSLPLKNGQSGDFRSRTIRIREKRFRIGGQSSRGEVTQFYDELKKVTSVDETVSAFYRDHIATHPYDYGDGWTFAPCQHHPFVTDEFVSSAATRNDKAIFIIGRVCGESGDFCPIAAAGICRSGRTNAENARKIL